jgi:hypothetical protein
MRAIPAASVRMGNHRLLQQPCVPLLPLPDGGTGEIRPSPSGQGGRPAKRKPHKAVVIAACVVVLLIVIIAASHGKKPASPGSASVVAAITPTQEASATEGQQTQETNENATEEDPQRRPGNDGWRWEPS